MARTAGRKPPSDQEFGEELEDSPFLRRDGMIGKDALAEFLDIPASTLDHWASRGGGPAFHGIGNHKKYWPGDVKAWLRSRRKEISSSARRGAA